MKSETTISNKTSASEIKDEILRRAGQHREQLDQEVERVTKHTKVMINNAVLIGGTLVAGYLLVKLLSGSSKKEKNDISDNSDKHEDHNRYESNEHHKSGIMSQVGSILASQAAMFLVDIAKNRLSGFLNSNNETEQVK